MHIWQISISAGLGQYRCRLCGAGRAIRFRYAISRWRALGPRGIREASTLFSFGHAGAYDHEDDVTYLEADKTKIVDIGDADIVHTDTIQSHANIEAGVRAILRAGAMPIILGGDHSVNIPCINAFADQEPFHLVQIDAHLDFVDERHGVKYGHGNPMRRAAEKPYVTGLSQIGIRNVSSTARDGYEDARKWDPTSSRYASSVRWG